MDFGLKIIGFSNILKGSQIFSQKQTFINQNFDLRYRYKGAQFTGEK